MENLKISDSELENALRRHISFERIATNEILKTINIAQDRRLCLRRGFPSMFDWLVKSFGYSPSAAQRRIQAARLLAAVPEVSERLADGRLTLSSASQISSAITSHERISGETVHVNEKERLIGLSENKSGSDVERILAEAFPSLAILPKADSRTPLTEGQTRHSLTLSQQATADLDRAKAVLSHKFPYAKDSEIVAYALQYLLDQIDPTRSAAAAAEVKRPTKKSIRKTIFKAAAGRCEYRDEVTGKVCGSTYQVEIDHIIPRALGGTDDPANLRCLCGVHNRMLAEEIFGPYGHYSSNSE